eukprot:TRINITY_DN563_c0_g2_i1.p1 TRINITY_DN563_c0_g2~~TRINITY_DN563_c0_g2_i1.p1  ORF type:complete len:376 (-),score=66.84 TRINITY_DN563_c0_g2_i1:176-1303(-)
MDIKPQAPRCALFVLSSLHSQLAVYQSRIASAAESHFSTALCDLLPNHIMMNTRIAVWICFYVLGSSLYYDSHAQAIGTSDCTISDDSCPCSQTASSGSCLKYQGDGSCLLGACQASYRCDCLGYEKCKRSSCAVYTAMENTIPSELVPFGCHLTAGAGSCTTFDSMLDTVEAAVNAKTDARHSSSEATSESVNAQHLVTEVQSDAAEINDELNAIDELRNQMTAEEEKEIFHNAKIVQELVTECTRKALNVTVEAASAFDQSMQAAEMAGAAISADRDCDKAKSKLEEEKSKVEREKQQNCPACKKLEEDIELLEKLRKEAAENAGKAAKSCRGNKDVAVVIVQEIREKRMNCGLAHGKVRSAIANLRKRLNQS